MKCLNINFINKIIYEDAERLVRESEINYQNQILNLCSNVTKKKGYSSGIAYIRTVRFRKNFYRQ